MPPPGETLLAVSFCLQPHQLPWQTVHQISWPLLQCQNFDL